MYSYMLIWQNVAVAISKSFHFKIIDSKVKWLIMLRFNLSKFVVQLPICMVCLKCQKINRQQSENQLTFYTHIDIFNQHTEFCCIEFNKSLHYRPIHPISKVSPAFPIKMCYANFKGHIWNKCGVLLRTCACMHNYSKEHEQYYIKNILYCNL